MPRAQPKFFASGTLARQESSRSLFSVDTFGPEPHTTSTNSSGGKSFRVRASPNVSPGINVSPEVPHSVSPPLLERIESTGSVVDNFRATVSVADSIDRLVRRKKSVGSSMRSASISTTDDVVPFHVRASSPVRASTPASNR
eukprot:TRINITY_DN49263_c0_g1_i1.p2 TRINITY_DN49263_c0_g1~~TRINITY_DN49263_c0_g1_i1.p2  ORF type:complete len:142 (-),score=1.71 TRINITY_DN49263_c0_g1_i1:536-961(-)